MVWICIKLQEPFISVGLLVIVIIIIMLTSYHHGRPYIRRPATKSSRAGLNRTEYRPRRVQCAFPGGLEQPTLVRTLQKRRLTRNGRLGDMNVWRPVGIQYVGRWPE